jgi:hypothetical protein
MKVHPPAIDARINVSRLLRELIILIKELTPGTVAVIMAKNISQREGCSILTENVEDSSTRVLTYNIAHTGITVEEGTALVRELVPSLISLAENVVCETMARVNRVPIVEVAVFFRRELGRLEGRYFRPDGREQRGALFALPQGGALEVSLVFVQHFSVAVAGVRHRSCRSD